MAFPPALWAVPCAADCNMIQRVIHHTPQQPVQAMLIVLCCTMNLMSVLVCSVQTGDINKPVGPVCTTQDRKPESRHSTVALTVQRQLLLLLHAQIWLRLQVMKGGSSHGVKLRYERGTRLQPGAVLLAMACYKEACTTL